MWKLDFVIAPNIATREVAFDFMLTTGITITPAKHPNSVKKNENIKNMIFSKYLLKFEKKLINKNGLNGGVVKTVWAEILHAKRYILDQFFSEILGVKNLKNHGFMKDLFF